MNTLIHADIFFFIATIWMVVVAAVLTVILWKIACILGDARHISKKLRTGSDVLSEDLNELRDIVRAKGANLSYIFKYFKHLFARRQDHKK